LANHARTLTSESLVILTVCLIGISVVQHHSTSQKSRYGIFGLASQVCESREDRRRHPRHRYRALSRNTFCERHSGQKIFLPNNVRRRNFCICASLGI
jgi:hypothetical protein